MKNVIFIVCMVFALLSAKVCLAENQENKFGIGVHGLMISPTDTENSFSGGLLAKYKFNERFALQLDADYFDDNGLRDVLISRNIIDSLGSYDGDLKVIPIVLNAQLMFPKISEKVIPYIGGGIGIQINNTDFSGMNSGRHFVYRNYEADVDNNFIWQMVFGLDMYLSKNVAFNAQVGYRFSEIDVKITTTNPVNGSTSEQSTDLDYDSLFANAGVIFYF